MLSFEQNNSKIDDKIKKIINKKNRQIMETNEFQDIFNLNADDFIEKTETRESELYKPDPKKGKDNVYKSLIRFIPFYKDPKKSKIKKYSYWLVDPLTSDGFSVDCPSSINQKSIIQDTFWKLKKSPSVAEQKLSEKFKRRENYYALVQILKDDQDPTLVGKIKVFKFGQKLNNILQGELQPEYGKPYNPFDPFKGRIMALTVTIVAGYNNYDTSKFVGDEAPVMLNGKPLKQDAQEMETFKTYLKENSPDLSNYDYKEWTDEIREKVKSVIENTVPTMRTAEVIKKEVSKPQNISVDSPSSQNVTNNAMADISTAEKVSKPLDMEDLNLDLDNTTEFDNDLYSGLHGKW